MECECGKKIKDFKADYDEDTETIEISGSCGCGNRYYAFLSTEDFVLDRE